MYSPPGNWDITSIQAPVFGTAIFLLADFFGGGRRKVAHSFTFIIGHNFYLCVLGHSRKYPVSHPQPHRLFHFWKHYNYICTASTLNTIIEVFGKHNTKQLHFAVNSCVLLILCLPALIFSPFQDEKQDISLQWPYNSIWYWKLPSASASVCPTALMIWCSCYCT